MKKKIEQRFVLLDIRLNDKFMWYCMLIEQSLDQRNELESLEIYKLCVGIQYEGGILNYSG